MEKKGLGNLFRGVLFGYIVFVLSGAVIMGVTALCLLKADNPGALVKPLSALALYLSVCIGGFVASKVSGEGAVAGLITGVAACLTVMLFSLLPLKPVWLGANTIVLYLAIVVSAAVSGFVGMKRRRKKRGRR